jgi:NAD(P)-dependent dehydrogenase (short-subunit alcohol dehydrogenase family)
MTSLERVAFITGGAHGIGRGIAERLLNDGYRVAIADRNAAQLRQTVDALGAGPTLLPLRMDVSKETDIRRGIARTLKPWGRLDLLVNNAGIANPHSGLDVQKWNQILATNLTGAFLCAKFALPALAKNRGSIVNIASTRALMSEPDTAAYSASKGGLVALTHSLAITYGPAVRVNVISPGWIATDPKAKLRPIDHRQHPVGRVGRPDDIAGLVAYLASSEAGFITGQNFVVDGGMTRKMIYVP